MRFNEVLGELIEGMSEDFVAMEEDVSQMLCDLFGKRESVNSGDLASEKSEEEIMNMALDIGELQFKTDEPDKDKETKVVAKVSTDSEPFKMISELD